MLASTFISGGYSTLRHPEPVAPAAEQVAVPLAQRIPKLPTDPEQLVRINGAVQVGAGALLALGRFPRFAALALAGTLVPTTLAGHRYWEEKDPEARQEQRVQFFKNLSLLGGLLITAADTHGKPSAAWRVRNSATTARKTSAAARKSASAGRRAGRVSARNAGQRAELARLRSANNARKHARTATKSARKRFAAS
ncbi:DoxX family protein [Streptomyces candidus]|uniref:Putative membrane protein YphA (DoxX/SURF4 family) n=1 Tax=Streptomyces candidus TaxID=67283 RepID=A0A7X0HMX9_9ACTN|nr:DoxX family protein [Streptomyces candidus]MBB6439324.1 putative membrane protein YphA (DoxX/SURF4 family) [Streptomyces candidus]GHH42352.1 hypothetical protein GCM10018773_26620 [Streptomyces candidus]